MMSPGLFSDMIQVQGLYMVSAFDYLYGCMMAEEDLDRQREQIEIGLCRNAWINL